MRPSSFSALRAAGMLGAAMLCGCPSSGVTGVDGGPSDLSVLHVALLDLGEAKPPPPLPYDMATQPILHIPEGAWPGTFSLSQPAIPIPTVGFNAGTNDTWLGGKGGLLVHSTGNNWNIVESPTQQNLVGMWGSAANDIYAVGAQLLHYDGTAWSLLRNNPGEQLVDVWGSGAADVWVVGKTASKASLLLHFDGHVWSLVRSQSGETLSSVWSASASDVWVAGYDNSGTILQHWDGTLFTAPPSTTTLGRVNKVRGSGPTDVWAYGNYPTVHWDGSAWTRVGAFLNQINAVTDLWAGAPNDVWITGIEPQGPGGVWH